jgi:hypothetical protein
MTLVSRENVLIECNSAVVAQLNATVLSWRSDYAAKPFSIPERIRSPAKSRPADD